MKVVSDVLKLMIANLIFCPFILYNEIQNYDTCEDLQSDLLCAKLSQTYIFV